jgi:hypothetical protein
MTEFSRFFPIPCETDLPKDLRRRITDTNSEIESLVADQLTLSGDIEQVRAGGGDLVSAFERSAGFEKRVADLVQREVELRRQVDGLLAERRNTLNVLAAKANSAFEAAKSDIERRLISIGYPPILPIRIDPSRILPGDVLKHPEVIAARQRAEELALKAGSHDLDAENRSHLKAASNCLQEIRDKLCRC